MRETPEKMEGKQHVQKNTVQKNTPLKGQTFGKEIRIAKPFRDSDISSIIHNITAACIKPKER